MVTDRRMTLLAITSVVALSACKLFDNGGASSPGDSISPTAEVEADKICKVKKEGLCEVQAESLMVLMSGNESVSLFKATPSNDRTEDNAAIHLDAVGGTLVFSRDLTASKDEKEISMSRPVINGPDRQIRVLISPQAEAVLKDRAAKHP